MLSPLLKLREILGCLALIQQASICLIGPISFVGSVNKPFVLLFIGHDRAMSASISNSMNSLDDFMNTTKTPSQSLRIL